MAIWYGDSVDTVATYICVQITASAFISQYMSIKCNHLPMFATMSALAYY